MRTVRSLPYGGLPDRESLRQRPSGQRHPPGHVAYDACWDRDPTRLWAVITFHGDLPIRKK